MASLFQKPATSQSSYGVLNNVACLLIVRQKNLFLLIVASSSCLIPPDHPPNVNQIGDKFRGGVVTSQPGMIIIHPSRLQIDDDFLTLLKPTYVVNQRLSSTKSINLIL